MTHECVQTEHSNYMKRGKLFLDDILVNTWRIKFFNKKYFFFFKKVLKRICVCVNKRSGGCKVSESQLNVKIGNFSLL